MRRLVLLVTLLWSVAVARDAAERWVEATEIPVLVHATAPEVRDRNGRLLRAYTVEDGLWRMALSLDRVDPLFFDMLVAYEDKRFYAHPGVDVVATSRAVWQGLRNGTARTRLK